MTEPHKRVLMVANVVAFAGVLVVNALSNVLPLNGYTAGELSDMYPNLFVPAGITFSIWGVIYLLLAGFCVYQFVEKSRLVERVGWLFVLSCAGNAGWLFAWHFRLVWLSLLVMIGLLLTLLAIYRRLDIARHAESTGERIFGHIAFGVYTGWISVALIANVTAFLVDVGWGGFGLSDAVWAVVMVCVAAGLGSAVVVTRHDPFYGLVFVWAFIGIIVKQSGSRGELAVAVAAAIGIAAVAVAILLRLLLRYAARR